MSIKAYVLTALLLVAVWLLWPLPFLFYLPIFLAVASFFWVVEQDPTGARDVLMAIWDGVDTDPRPIGDDDEG